MKQLKILSNYSKFKNKKYTIEKQNYWIKEWLKKVINFLCNKIYIITMLFSFLIWLFIYFSLWNIFLMLWSRTSSHYNLRFNPSLTILIQFILLSEVDLINWFFRSTLESSFHLGDLIMFVHCVAWEMILI